MIIFWRLLLAHFLTDYTLQTNKMAVWKSKSTLGVLAHASIFLVLSVIFTWNYLGQQWWKLPGWLCVLILFIIHFIEDEYRVKNIKKELKHDNFLFFLWDQIIHIILIFLFSPPTGEIIEEKLVVLAVLVIFVTHFTSIVIYYLEQVIYGYDQPVNRLRGKYYFIIDRLVVFTCFLLPGYWWLIFLIIWLMRPLFYKILRIYDFTWLNTVLGNMFAVLIGVLARLIVY